MNKEIRTKADGYIYLWRKILDSSVFSDSKYLHVWIDILLHTNWKPKKIIIEGKTRTINRGEQITSQKGISKRTGVHLATVHRILKWLENENQIEKQTTNKFTFIKVLNWKHYQTGEKQNEKQNENKMKTKLKQNETTNKDKKDNIKKTIKKNIYTHIFKHWNSKGIIKHRSLTRKMKRAISGRLRENYAEDEIIHSIDNYAEILFDKAYYFKYKWTLQDFLQRGFEKFLSLEVAKQNYKKRKEDDYDWRKKIPLA